MVMQQEVIENSAVAEDAENLIKTSNYEWSISDDYPGNGERTLPEQETSTTGVEAVTDLGQDQVTLRGRISDIAVDVGSWIVTTFNPLGAGPGRGHKKPLDKEILNYLRNILGLKLEDIAERLEVTHSHVYCELVRHELHERKHKPHTPKDYTYKTFTAELLNELINKQELSNREIARRYDVDEKAIRRHRKRHNI